LIEYEKEVIYKAYYDNWFDYVRIKKLGKENDCEKFYAIKLFIRGEQIR
jgi:hypothetical protein